MTADNARPVDDDGWLTRDLEIFLNLLCCHFFLVQKFQSYRNLLVSVTSNKQLKIKLFKQWNQIECFIFESDYDTKHSFVDTNKLKFS